jgi:hypothetical protein
MDYIMCNIIVYNMKGASFIYQLKHHNPYHIYDATSMK